MLYYYDPVKKEIEHKGLIILMFVIVYGELIFNFLAINLGSSFLGHWGSGIDSISRTEEYAFWSVSSFFIANIMFILASIISSYALINFMIKYLADESKTILKLMIILFIIYKIIPIIIYIVGGAGIILYLSMMLNVLFGPYYFYFWFIPYILVSVWIFVKLMKKLFFKG